MPAASRPSDPFAGLPRLSPLPPDIELIQTTPPASGGRVAAATTAGRRRAPERRRPDVAVSRPRRAGADEAGPER